MEWLEVFVEIPEENLEMIESVLIYDCDLTGLVIHNSDDFNDFVNQPSREWDYIADELVDEKTNEITGITFYVTNDDEGKKQLSLATKTLGDLNGDFPISLKNVAEEDWANTWKQFFKPFPVGDKLLVKPSWEELPEDIGNRKVINIDPANVFGTGTHETTKLCLELMEMYVDNSVDNVDKLLDIGCGSGILSIGGLLLGISNGDAVDIDPNAVGIAYDNCDRNNIPHHDLQVVAGNILEDKQLHQKYSGNKYKLVIANIVADIIIALTKQVPEYIEKNGVFICSGIISERVGDVKNSLEKANFKILETKQEKDWVAIATRYEG